MFCIFLFVAVFCYIRFIKMFANEIRGMEATINFLLDTRRAKMQSGLYPVKLRVTYQRRTRNYSTGVDLSEEDYRKFTEGKYIKGELKNITTKLEKMKASFIDARKLTTPFSFDRFERNLNPVVSRSSKDLYALFDVKIEELNNAQQISTARSYSTTLNWIKKYSSRKSLGFVDISLDWLNGFEQYLLKEETSTGTIGIYMRNLRHIYNRAVDSGYIDRQLYPFGKKKFRIKSPNRTKKSLSLPQVSLLVEYWRTAEGPEKTALDYWLFSLTSNGINMRDILEIKWKNLDNEQICIRRNKTKTSNANQAEIIIHLNDINREVINRNSVTVETQGADEFVFPGFTSEMTDAQKFEKNHDKRQYVTKYVKRIGVNLGIPTKISFETARHTFANSMKYSHVSTSIISNMMGHSSTATTDNYLGTIVAEEEKKLIHDFVKSL